MQLFLKYRTGCVHVDPVNVCECIHQADHEQDYVGGGKNLLKQTARGDRYNGLHGGGGHRSSVFRRNFYQQKRLSATIFFAVPESATITNPGTNSDDWSAK